MFTIYNDSIFVPVGRGNSSIDCFRIYEAILSGSIPVIVCEEEEFIHSFYFNGELPPFLFAKSWDKAIEKCELLLKNSEELIHLQKLNYEWLHNKFKFLHKLILNSLL
jgi:hypothetical protein